MGMTKNLGAAAVTSGTPTPVLFAAASSPFTTYSITSMALANGTLTFTITGTLPVQVGTNKQIVLWGLSVYTDLNGKKVQAVIGPNGNTFAVPYNGSHSGTDTGECGLAPFQHYRAIRLECGQTNGADFVYVGNNNVSSSQYVAALSLSGQLNIEIACDNIPAECICIDGTTTTTDTVQVSLIY